MTVASLEMDDGAAVPARAISALRSIKVLIEGRHAGVRVFGILGLRVPGCTQGKGQRKESQRDHLDCLSFHVVFS